MKKLFIFLLSLTGTLAVQAQKVYFIYLQSDNGSPFFVKMGEKVQSSTASGYVILSNLIDSTYTFSVGFPGKTTESKFSVTLNKEDKGYLLKTFENGLSLFDLQSLTISKAIAAAKEPVPVDAAVVAAADPFTRLLAQASDDPNIYLSGPNSNPQKEQVVIAKKEVKPEVKRDTQTTVMLPAANTTLAVIAMAKEETPKVPDTTASVEAIKPAEASTVTTPVVSEMAPESKSEKAYQRSIVTRRSESSTTEGFGLVFLDNESGVVDTIRLLIPNPKMVAVVADPETTPVTAVALKASNDVVADPPQVTKSEIEKSQPGNVQGTLEGKAATAIVPEAPACVTIATEKEFLKLRKNMAAADDEPGMLSIARKDFSKKCFSTEQVRHLSALFLTSIGKYNFFEAAYTHVSDAEQFAGLETELKDDSYQKRFKALLVK